MTSTTGSAPTGSALMLAESWRARGARAERLLQKAHHAPALFKPETIESAQRDLAAAHHWVSYWSSQLAGRPGTQR